VGPSQRPQTLAFALTDFPVGQLSWIAERFRDWTAGEVPDETVDRDSLLTNVMLYWLTDTAASSSRIYKENASSWGQDDRHATVPAAIATLPANIASPCVDSQSRLRTSSTGQTYPKAATSPDSKSPTCSPQTSAPS